MKKEMKIYIWQIQACLNGLQKDNNTRQWGCNIFPKAFEVTIPTFLMSNFSNFVGLAYQGKDIVLRFIIEFSSSRDFGPLVVGLFLYEDFRKMTFWLVLKLEISYRVMIS
jgi:hypothetical protein